MFKVISKIYKHLLNLDGHIQAPPITWNTSLIGAKWNYLKNAFIDTIRPNKAGQQFFDIMVHHPDEKAAKTACEIFEHETGIKMYMTNPEGAQSFSTNANILIRWIKEGKFPKQIKHIVIGHGAGTTVDDTWHVAFEPNVKIDDFIAQRIPKGEMVLVNCCEGTPKSLRHLIPKDKPAIGKSASEFDSTYTYPAKVVISGQKGIVGGYANGILTLYK